MCACTMYTSLANSGYPRRRNSCSFAGSPLPSTVNRLRDPSLSGDKASPMMDQSKHCSSSKRTGYVSRTPHSESNAHRSRMSSACILTVMLERNGDLSCETRTAIQGKERFSGTHISRSLKVSLHVCRLPRKSSENSDPLNTAKRNLCESPSSVIQVRRGLTSKACLSVYNHIEVR